MMAAVGMGLQAGAAVGGGINAKRAGDVEAKQFEIAGGQAKAAAQRRAQEELRKGRLVQSRAQAVAAASGAGATDPTVADIIGGIAGESAYRAAVALFEGDEQARAYSMKGSAARAEGKARRNAGYLQAAKTLLSGGSSMHAKYGGGGYGTIDPTEAGEGLPY